MGFDQYSAVHKTWDHVGNVTPNFEVSEAHRPYGEFMPADWLPVGRYDKYFEDYFSISAGKIVALDRQGRVVPAGFKVAFGTTSSDQLTYSATDVTEGTIDLTTGAAVAAACGYTRDEITAALLSRGLVDDGENAEDFIGFPVGVAMYNFYQWAGGDGFNPAGYKKHNYNMQHRVAVLCKYVIEMPLVPAVQSAFDISGATAIQDEAITDWPDASGQWVSSTGLSLTSRYAADVTAGDDVVALVLPNRNIAKNTTNTPVTFSATTVWVTAKNSIAELSAAGDYFFDYDVGVILAYEADGDAALGSPGTVTFYCYETEPTTVGTYACAVGELRPGDFVRADKNSNFCKARVFASTDAELTGFINDYDDATDLTTLVNAVLTAQREIIGQVLEIEQHPKDLLQYVRTAYPQLGVADQMPGSATSGLPASLTLSGGSDKVVRILLLK